MPRASIFTYISPQQSLNASFRNALQNHQRGSEEAAARIFLNCLESDPGFSHPGNYPLLENGIRTYARKAETGNTDALMNLGLYYFFTGDLPGAHSALSDLLQRQPTPKQVETANSYLARIPPRYQSVPKQLQPSGQPVAALPLPSKTVFTLQPAPALASAAENESEPQAAISVTRPASPLHSSPAVPSQESVPNQETVATPRARTDDDIDSRTYDPGPNPNLAAMLQDLGSEEVYVKKVAIWRLGFGRFSAPEVISALTQQLAVKDDLLIQETLEAFGKIGKPSAPAVPTIVKLLDKGSSAQRFFAIQTLGKIAGAPQQSIPALLKHLTSENAGLAQASRKAVTCFGQEAVPFLEEALDSATGSRKTVLSKLLSQLGHSPD